MMTPAHAETGRQIKVNIPFEFNVGKKLLPAGTYQCSVTIRMDKPVLSLKSDKDVQTSIPIITRLDRSAFRDASLIFDSADKHRTLSEVWITGEPGILVYAGPKEHTHEIVIASGSDLSETLSGKEVFDRTCKRCHGTDGAGSAVADKFFQLNIPKLNGQYVQSKSDSELKDIITQGKGNMESVRIGGTTMQHSLGPQSVNAVIGYVRTLKQS
jgi:hypothetical protein